MPKTADTEDAPPRGDHRPDLAGPCPSCRLAAVMRAMDTARRRNRSPAAGSGRAGRAGYAAQPVETAKSPDPPERSEAAGPAKRPPTSGARPRPRQWEPAALPPETTDTPSAPVAPTTRKGPQVRSGRQPLTPDKPDGAAPRPARFTPVAAPGDAWSRAMMARPSAGCADNRRTTRRGTPFADLRRRGPRQGRQAHGGRRSDRVEPARAAWFQARRRHRDEEPVLHPDAAAPTSSESRTGAAGPAKPGNRLAAHNWPASARPPEAVRRRRPCRKPPPAETTLRVRRTDARHRPRTRPAGRGPSPRPGPGTTRPREPLPSARRQGRPRKRKRSGAVTPVASSGMRSTRDLS